MNDKVWFKDPIVLITRMTEFFPTSAMSREARVNALFRMVIYISIVISMYYSNPRFLLGILVMGFISVITYSSEPSEPSGTFGIKSKEQFQDSECTKPTIANPFMNQTMGDYLNLDIDNNIKSRPAACDIRDPKINKMVNDTFNNNLYTDTFDLGGSANAQRNFHTSPLTTIPNNREDFQNWLYKMPDTCKENQDYCYTFEDIRTNRQVFPDPSVNPTRPAV